jgi:CelD/BcsL family acetyltransferase involved in cellulose biosynthesis
MQPCRAYFCFDDGETISIYNSGFDPALQYFSPGWVLLSDLIQWSIENSRARLDFMRGNEAYNINLVRSKLYLPGCDRENHTN